jgi:mannosyltransferase
MRRHYWIILASLVLALVRTIGLDYWYDEAFTWILVHQPLANLLHATANDVHPPLYYLIVAVTSRIIPGELGTRAWSVICQAAMLLILWRLLDRLKIEPRLRLPILALVALLPVELLYATEGRMYAQFQLLVMVQLLAVMERRWWLLGIATTLALYTHNYAVFYSLVIGLAALVVELRTTCAHPIPVDMRHLAFVNFDPDQSQFRRIFLALGIPILLWLPWVYFGVIPQARLAASGQHWIQPITIGQSLYDLFMVVQTTDYPKVLTLALYMVVAFGLILTVRSAWRAKQWLLLALAFGPWLLASLASIITPLLLYRALLPSIPFLCILVMGAIWRDTTLRPWSIVVVVATISISLIGIFTSDYGTVDRNGVLDLHTPIPSNTLLVHLDDSSLVTFGAYPQPGVSQAMLIGCPESLGSLRPVVRQAMQFGEIRPEDLPQHYVLVAWVGPLSTPCHLDLYNRLRAGSRAIAESKTAFGEGGIYDVTR